MIYIICIHSFFFVVLIFAIIRNNKLIQKDIDFLLDKVEGNQDAIQVFFKSRKEETTFDANSTWDRYSEDEKKAIVDGIAKGFK